jgi:hypothetical protein
VNAGAVTVPEASLPTVTLLDQLAENTPLAPPVALTLKVTGIPAIGVVTGQPLLFANAACKFVANALPSVVVCGVPATNVSSFGGLGDGQVSVSALLGLLLGGAGSP